jgi:hypothetical protein
MPLGGQVASGDINPSRFVTKSGAHTVAQAGAGAIAIGVSHEGSKTAPIPGASSLAAQAGDPIAVYSDGEACLIELGATVAAGAFVKPDSVGRAITAASTEKYSAVVERGGAVGQKVECYIRTGVV